MSRDRRWLELRVRTQAAEGHELVPDVLVDLGARGVVEEDEHHIAYFEEPTDADAFAGGARDTLEDAIPGVEMQVEWRWQAHEEWAEAWKRGLGPRRITDRLVVHPSWKPPSDVRPGDIVIVLDPGMAFGTAEHGTTRGCLRLLDGTVAKGERVLDVGAGSGMPYIAVGRLGAAEVVAVEGAPLACEAMADNLRRNGVVRRVLGREVWVDASALTAMGPFEGVMANIETGLLLPLLPGLTAAVAPQGWLLLSGILEGELDAVLAAAEDHGFGNPEVDADGEWRSALFRPGPG